MNSYLKNIKAYRYSRLEEAKLTSVVDGDRHIILRLRAYRQVRFVDIKLQPCPPKNHRRSY